MQKFIPLTLIAVLAGSLQAATIAYWRFEDSPGFLNDSAGSNSLTNNGSVSQVTSPFSDPVPQTGAANAEAASFSGSNYLTGADNTAFTSNQFTLEAYFTTGSVGGTSTRVIAGHFGSGGSFTNEKSYAIAVNNSKLRLLLGIDSGANTSNFEAFTLSDNANYYAAAAVDVTDTGSSAVTLYLQDLSTSTLQVFNSNRTGSGGEVMSIYNAAAPFSIGATSTPSAEFTGTIDEVRFSNTKLAQSELLAIPEPGSLALMGVALLAGLAFLRRKH
ncbi:MAG: LamG-like jellyroll fold domain-containing protein [Opitutales bacterium]